MAKKKSTKSNKSEGETNTSFMFPSLHQAVTNAVSQGMAVPWFCDIDTDRGVRNKWTTHVIGRFRCRNRNTCCTKGWSSKKVAILIRGYDLNGYNAVVFNQRCRTCDQLGTLTLDENSYVERVADRIQIWAGVQVRRSGRHRKVKTSKPHERALCEGCKRGVCRQTDGWEGEYY
ncbi:hypothetical protein A1O7_06106 [Cladophialophora yegresii CBS 114405]|uniref:3CxxC-type domain-containing protein n=1 Tax=Cladophialophora yegresii CBS 114405 TaxID=1182544 RepID=W9VSY6_9EURO|nr:uncharacterized protein A1O7_06106 [Cladophialophora yegresii CBS 114405]EXJ58678.1 hypothetical protein A1O7_06106 [Cladophialophora yegresii CBS 114405]